jgi:hypothetical protein
LLYLSGYSLKKMKIGLTPSVFPKPGKEVLRLRRGERPAQRSGTGRGFPPSSIATMVK